MPKVYKTLPEVKPRKMPSVTTPVKKGNDSGGGAPATPEQFRPVTIEAAPKAAAPRAMPRLSGEAEKSFLQWQMIQAMSTMADQSIPPFPDAKALGLG